MERSNRKEKFASALFLHNKVERGLEDHRAGSKCERRSAKFV
jgi:hypothetical protein